MAPQIKSAMRQALLNAVALPTRPVRSYFADVGAFNDKFKLPVAAKTALRNLDEDLVKYRVRFMIEELVEFCDAQGLPWVATELAATMRRVAESTWHPPIEGHGQADGGDALVDLIYVALGTAHFMGLPFEDMWEEVQRANLSKKRVAGKRDKRSKRKHALDLYKPKGWRGPDHWPALIRKAGDR